MSRLESNEQVAKVVMENFFVPSLHEILEKADPTKYRMWSGNACRQTAIMGVKALENLLPLYKWTAWDGDFSDIHNGRRVTYNHAWIYGTYEKRKLLIDLSRVNKERLFITVPKNAYPKSHPEYKDMTLIRKKLIDIDKSLEEYEYYTGIKGVDLSKMISAKMLETALFK